MAPGEAERIGELLIQEGAVTQEEISRAIAEGGIKGTVLAAVLEGSPHVRRADLAAFLAADFRIPVLEDLRRVELSDACARLVPEELARKHELVPIARIGNILCVAKANYFNRAAIVDLHNVVDGKIKVLQADELQVRAAIERVYRGRRGELPAPSGGRKPDTAAMRAAPPPVAESAALEAIPLISMPDEDADRAPAPVPARLSAAVAERGRSDVVDEVIEILDAVRIPSQEYATAVRDPFARLVVEFDDLFKVGKAVAPPRLV
jgi:hypothetical protein